MTRSSATLTRQERRLQERDERREQKRDRRQRGRNQSFGWSLTSITLAALALGIAGVVGIAVITAPPPSIELNEPVFRSPSALSDGMTLGSADAPVTLELWSDYQCPACGTFTRTMEPPLVDEYVETGKVKIVYRDLSFLGSESVAAAVAARVAGETNQYWQYHDYLFANQSGEQQGAFSQTRLEAMATAVGLDLVAFRAGQADPAVRQAVAAEGSAGDQAGIANTPTLVINGQRITGVPSSYAALKAVIDQALAATE